MKLLQHIHSENISNLFLYGAIMFANIDYVGVADYLIKAILGGAVWFIFKLLQDHYSEKIRGINRMKSKPEDHDEHDEHQIQP